MEACVDQPAHGADRVSAQFPAASLHMQPEGLGRPRPLKASAPAPPLGVLPHLQPPFSGTPPPGPWADAPSLEAGDASSTSTLG